MGRSEMIATCTVITKAIHIMRIILSPRVTLGVTMKSTVVENKRSIRNLKG